MMFNFSHHHSLSKYFIGNTASSTASTSSAAELRSTSIYAVSEFDDISDSQSLMSMPYTGTGTGFKKIPSAAATAKKAAVSIQKLKSEVAQLREALHTNNMSDINMLHKKLRSANFDLSRLRELNFELKDRVQELEGSLYEAINKKENATEKDVKSRFNVRYNERENGEERS